MRRLLDMKNIKTLPHLKSILFFLISLTILPDINAQDLAWAKHIGGHTADHGLSITTDIRGNVYVTGNFGDTVDFEPGPGITKRISNGGDDVFISKYDAVGNLIWVRSLGGNDNDEGLSIAVDSFGNVYTTGWFFGSVDFDPGSNTHRISSKGDNDVFVLKLDSSGNFEWVKTWGGAGSDFGQSISIDNQGNVYTTGTFEGTVDFDPGLTIFNLTSTDSNHSAVFISKLDNKGNLIWAGAIKGNNPQSRCIIVNGQNVYLTGDFADTVDFDPGTLVHNLISTNGTSDIFVAKLDAGGHLIWVKGMGGTGGDYGKTVITDDLGNVYTTGWFRGTADFNPGIGVNNLTAGGMADAFISKLDSAGNYIWAKSMGSSFFLDMTESQSITLDALGNVYTTGDFQGTVDFNPGIGAADTAYLTAPGFFGMFISKLDALGNFVWAKGMKSVGGSANIRGMDVTADITDNIYITGGFSNTIDFDPGIAMDSLTSNGSDDIFIQKLYCSDTSSSIITAQVCHDSTYILNGTVYMKSGVYTQIYPNAAGCDSTITLNLIIDPIPDIFITVSGFTLSTTAQYNTYQWILNGNAIPGATSNTYTIIQNGNYAVAVTGSGGCSDTSDIYIVANYTGVIDINTLASSIEIYPNPSSDVIYIKAPVKVNVTLSSIAGKVIRQIKNAQTISVKDLATGLYLLQITNQEGTLIKVEKVVKQRQ